MKQFKYFLTIFILLLVFTLFSNKFKSNKYKVIILYIILNIYYNVLYTNNYYYSFEKIKKL